MAGVTYIFVCQNQRTKIYKSTGNLESNIADSREKKLTSIFVTAIESINKQGTLKQLKQFKREEINRICEPHLSKLINS